MTPITYRLSAFDSKTGKRLKVFSVPAAKVKIAKKNAGLPYPFYDFAGEQPLTLPQAEFIAELIGAQIDSRWNFFLSPLSEAGKAQVEHA